MPPKGRRVGAALGEIRASGRVVLACRGCGERLLLLGQEDDWAGEGRLAFRCAGCGGRVELANDRVDEEWHPQWVRALYRGGA